MLYREWKCTVRHISFHTNAFVSVRGNCPCNVIMHLYYTNTILYKLVTTWICGGCSNKAINAGYRINMYSTHNFIRCINVTNVRKLFE